MTSCRHVDYSFLKSRAKEKILPKCQFLLHMSKKSSTFAAVFAAEKTNE